LTGIVLGGSKTEKNRIPEDFFFLYFQENCFAGTWFWRGSLEFMFLSAVTEFFCWNSCGTGICICTGFLRIPPDSCSRQKLSGLDQQLKKACSVKYGLKQPFFNLSLEQDLTMAFAAPVLCWRLRT
jgi:hypothetical protein